MAGAGPEQPAPQQPQQPPPQPQQQPEPQQQQPARRWWWSRRSSEAAAPAAAPPPGGTAPAAAAAAAAAGSSAAPETAAATSSGASHEDGARSSAAGSTPTAEQQQPEQQQHQEQQQQQQPEEEEPPPGADNPMLQTALTRRFIGRFTPMQMPSHEMMQQEDLMNNCGVKSVIAGVMGGLLGVAFGVFTASLDTQGIDAAPMGETKPTRVVLRETWVLMKDKSRSYAKGFGGMGFLYSGTECAIEKYRARHDKWNATLAGCATGGMLAAPGGAKAACFGCASFAAFSTAIEYFTGGH